MGELRFRSRLSPECTDLIRQCLRVQSDQRPTLEALLRHPWLQQPTATTQPAHLPQPPTAAAYVQQQPSPKQLPQQQLMPAAAAPLQQFMHPQCPRIPEDKAAGQAPPNCAGTLPIPLPKKICVSSNHSGLNSAGSSYCSSVSSTSSTSSSA